MITYTVFDPDDASHVTYRWYGEDDTTVYVYVDGGEYDAFELGDAEPSVAAVAAAVVPYHEEHHAGRASGPPPSED